MKQSISTTTVLEAILAFTFIFAAFIAVTLTYNKTFKTKNEVISIIEKYEGFDPNNKSLELINNYLLNTGYNAKGICNEGEYGVNDLKSIAKPVLANGKDQYYYCLSYHCSDNKCKVNRNHKSDEQKVEIYYGVKLFFKFNLPIIGDINVFKVTGETKAIKLYENSQKFS